MSQEQAERLIAILRNIHHALIFNVGLGLAVAIGLGALSIASQVWHLRP